MPEMNALDPILQCIESLAQKNGEIMLSRTVWEEFCDRGEKKILVKTTAVPSPAPKEASTQREPRLSVSKKNRFESWDQLRNAVENCTACPLHLKRTHPVFGEGDIHADLMFIGEGPGEKEDLSGHPFVGPAGELLTKMIQAMKLSRETVYIANVVKCRPPRNRDPEPDEVQCCLPYLEEQIERIQPKVIVLLGTTAVKRTVKDPPAGGISSLIGKWLEVKGIPAMPIFHPSYLIRLASNPEKQQAEKRIVWSALQTVMQRL